MSAPVDVGKRRTYKTALPFAKPAKFHLGREPIAHLLGLHRRGISVPKGTRFRILARSDVNPPLIRKRELGEKTTAICARLARITCFYSDRIGDSPTDSAASS